MQQIQAVAAALCGMLADMGEAVTQESIEFAYDMRDEPHMPPIVRDWFAQQTDYQKMVDELTVACGAAAEPAGQKLYFTHSARSLADPFDYEIDYDENTAADVIDHFACYAHPNNTWQARSRKPTMAQYEHFMLCLRAAVNRGESFRADYCGERIEVQACKVPAIGLARFH